MTEPAEDEENVDRKPVSDLADNINQTFRPDFPRPLLIAIWVVCFILAVVAAVFWIMGDLAISDGIAEVVALCCSVFGVTLSIDRRNRS